MVRLNYEVLANRITCIDAGYVKPGTACFYLLEQDGEYAVVETGTSHSVPALLHLMSERDIHANQIRYVIPTHVHLDHAGGAGTMMAAFPQAQLLIHPRGARHMAKPDRLTDSARAVYGEATFHQLYGEILPVDAGRIRELGDGDSVDLAGRLLQVRHTRGHANHHFCIWDEQSMGWFSGDMFGVSYPWFRFPDNDFVLPSTTPTQFDPDDFLASLSLLDSYHPQRMYLTHFGELAYTPAKAELLRQQIAGYCELAQRYADDPDQLEQQLGDYGLKLLHGRAEAPVKEQREWLSFDVALNAQGLLAWQNRSR